MTNQLCGWEFCVEQLGTFHGHQDYEQVNFYQKSRLFIVGRSVRDEVTTYLQLARNWNVSTKIWQNLFLYRHSQLLYDVMQKKIDNLEFVQCANFAFRDSLKNNSTKYCLTFDDSCEKIRNSKAFVDFATGGRDRGLSTINIEHNLFHQSKLVRHVEFQNTHIVLFESPRDVMQVSTVRAQLGLGLGLIDWYRDARSVAYGHSLIDLSPRIDDRLRYRTKTGSIRWKISVPERLNRLKSLDDEHTKSLYPPSFTIIFPQVQKQFLSVLSKKKFTRFLCECIINMLRGNLQSIKRDHVAKFQSEIRLLSLKRTSWKQRKDIVASEKGSQLMKVKTTPVKNNLSWQGAVCPRSCFCVQQKFDYPVSYKAGTFKVSTFKKHPTYEIDSLEINKKLFVKADSSVDKILFCPRIKLSNTQTLILDGFESGNFLSDFAQQLRHKNTDVPDIYFT